MAVISNNLLYRNKTSIYMLTITSAFKILQLMQREIQVLKSVYFFTEFRDIELLSKQWLFIEE